MPHIYRVEVSPRPELANGRAYVVAAHQLGIAGLTRCQTHRLYFLLGNISQVEIIQLAQTCLADPVTEQFTIHNSPFTIHHSQFTIIS